MTVRDAHRRLLDALGLPAGPPSPRAFEELFLRFQARVPYRRGPMPLSADSDALLLRFAESGRGGGGVERREAFAALGRSLGYPLDVVPARREDGSPHGALVVELSGEDVLADVSLPLPVLVPLGRPGVEIPAAFGTLGVERDGDAWRLLLSAHGRTAPLLTAASGASLPLPAAPGPGEDGALLRFLPDRVLCWTGGRMEVRDAWSVLSFPLSGAATEMLEALFVQPVEDLAGVEADASPATLTAFHSSADGPEELHARLASPERFSRLLPPGLATRDVRPAEGGWEWEVATEEGEPLRRERVRVEERGLHVTTLGGSPPLVSRRFVVQAGEDGSRLVLEAVLAGELPLAGPPDAVRRTLVFHLAAELIALATPA